MERARSALKAVRGVASVDVSLPQVTVVYDDSSTGPDQLRKVLEKEGFYVEGAPEVLQSDKDGR